MDPNKKPTNLLESKLDHEIARCDSGPFKKLSHDDRGNFVAMDIDVPVKTEGSYSEHEAHEKDNQFLRNKLSELEREVKVLREKNEELQLCVASVEKCEKQSAEREVDVWKQKCKELESQLWALQGRSCFGGKEELVNDGHMLAAVNNVIQDGGICYLTTPDKPVDLKQGIEVINLDEDEHDESNKPSKKQLCCGDDETNGEKTSPCTPARARRRATFTVDTIDADEKDHISNADLLSSGYQGYSVLTPFTSKEAIPYSKASSKMGEGDEDMSDCNEKFSFVATPKKKRSINVVSSDDDDDNIPIAQFVRKHFPQSVPQPVVSESDDDSYFLTHRRHRLIKLSQYEGRKKTPKTDESENDDDENSLGSFIASSSDGSESPDESSGEAEYFSDDNSDDYHGIIQRIKRTKDLGSEWELEGDMLAAFGKDPVLCMKAVCALYRQQTSDEQACHGTFVLNRRGFSTFDAQRGTELAEFLTDKIPNGDVTKSVEQLNEFDPDGLEKCRALATRYSKQLFEIYQNEEDPHFFPP